MSNQWETEMHNINMEFTNLVCDITRNTLKVGAVLRLLQLSFDTGNDNNISQEDMSALIDLCVDVLPRDYQDIHEPLDKLSDRYCMAFKNSNDLVDKTKAKLQVRHAAMTAIANPDTTVEELTEAGMNLHRMVQENPEHDADWITWLKCVEARGYAVGWLVLPSVNPKLCLTAAGLPGFKTPPAPDSVRHIVKERLSADQIEMLGVMMGAGVEGYIKSALASHPEPMCQETAGAS